MKIIGVLLLCLPGTLQAQVKTQKKISVQAKMKSAGNQVQQSAERGKALYQVYCLACHQKDGGGVGTLNPPFVQEWAGGDKTRIIRMILKSSVGKVEIDGDRFSNTMPAQPFLTDQQLADVLTYVRSNFGIKASAVTAAEVRAVRAKTK